MGYDTCTICKESYEDEFVGCTKGDCDFKYCPDCLQEKICPAKKHKDSD